MLLTALALALFVPLAAAHPFEVTVRNNCPNAFRVLVNGKDCGGVGPATSKLVELASEETTIGASINNAPGLGTSEAVFWGEKFYYYLVKTQQATNVGIRAGTNHSAQATGFCTTAECADATAACADSFTAKQTFVADNLPVAAPPALPVRACPFGTAFPVVEFCPGGTLPPGWEATGQDIQLQVPGTKEWCVGLCKPAAAPGAPVQLRRCDGARSQKWILPSPAMTAGPIKLADEAQLCLDSTPTGGAAGQPSTLSMRTCSGGASQQWKYDPVNGNNRFVNGNGKCLENVDGATKDGNALRVAPCVDNTGPRQQWLVSLPPPA